jgi:serine/threonine protein kinase
VTSAPDIPGHTVTSVLGTGGFAAVYRGWQRAVGREVAIKIDNRVLFTERDRRRFFREVTAAGRLSGHPHVIDVYDAGMLGDGRPYLVMELCPGGSLNDELRRYGPMSAERVTWIGVRLADALAAAHAAGVLHRDIKPANILINQYGVVGLADFGLASIIAATGEQTVTREALTPAFAPPESFRNAEPTTAADIYSLAATLYMLLAGRPPRFPAGEPSPGLATIAVLHDRPVEDVPGAPPELMAILRQGLAADPAQRPATATALRDALAELDLPSGGQPTPARHLTVGSQPGPVRPTAADSPGSAPPTSGIPVPPDPLAPGQGSHGAWPPSPVSAAQSSWPPGQVPAPAPPLSWLPGQEAPSAWDSAPHSAGPAPGWDPGVPATGDYWSGGAASRPRRHDTEGTSPSGPGTPAPRTGAPGYQAGPQTHQAGPRPGPSFGASHRSSDPGHYRGGPARHPAGAAGYPGAPAAPVTQPPAAQRPGRRRPMALAAALGGGLVLVVVAALLAGAHFFGPGRAPQASTPGAAQPGGSGSGRAGPGGVPPVFGVSTVTSGCPAASVGSSGARCPASPECWNGIVEIEGDTTVRSLPCAGDHVWETFAIGILPADASTFDAELVAKDPTVSAICSLPVLLRSRAGAALKIPAAAWEIQVVPPDEAAYDSGARAYRCLAHVTAGPDPVTSQFRR